MNMTTKIHELQRQITLLSKRARTARYQHTKDKYLAVAAAKRQHLRDLIKLDNSLRKVSKKQPCRAKYGFDEEALF
ncbi:hypothetical protein CLV24_11434 [Pontibacter ummariensis]|uniref:Uncharacterized protein n=1 Tax=Pontibacter ummariensis TaxID=1610492 RepID=A0A239HKM4_9BACT|nr:hypothetical protein [Pontibacter ummariensis]PRY10306.1 hypothetical protein CLV24_11434 [Pontibacter ummariensis]SNS81862.1 hypothetical protein SAMN06296052_11434 [Pontibacter ummariensis]